MERKVLLLEDDPVFEAIVGRLLHAIDPAIKMDCVATACDAVAKLESADYDLVVADIFLEGKLTGLDVWEICRLKSPLAPFVFISSMPVEQFRSVVEKGGFYPPYLMKPPSTLENWQRTIESALGGRAVSEWVKEAA